MSERDLSEVLIKKYDVQVPRYTSYPTIPYWDTKSFTESQWQQRVKQCFDETNRTKGISLYIHLPFCESLCTYCACNTRITKNHDVEESYVRAVLSEWEIYKNIFRNTPVIRELHLGGGTPTFFSPENLNLLISGLLDGVVIHNKNEFSFEGHPNNTTAEHLAVLHNLDFQRVSYGVQDLDPKVQSAINRIQPFENLERVTKLSRLAGFKSISFDLIYGLPYQTVDSVRQTVEKVITLMPDRISFYSYAHVPWLKPSQRGYEDSDLPTDIVKRSLYETGKELFEKAGYLNIGMDHFARPDDALAKAQQERTLHRNFMGYTTNQTDLLVGLGASAISDAKYAYAQNEKKVEDYKISLEKGKVPVAKGHLQTSKDLLIRQSILDIACIGELGGFLLQKVIDYRMYEELCIMDQEGIVSLFPHRLVVKDRGRPFIRNICSVFDVRMRDQHSRETELFSKAI